jgi:lysophospholipase L1-like esterase
MKTMSRVFLFVLIGSAVTGPLVAQPAQAPRILLAGDSWSAFMEVFKTFNSVLSEREGLESYRSTGVTTSIVGIRAYEYAAPAILALVTEALAEHPTIDIVHLSLGGNDVLYGGWRPSMNETQAQALYHNVTGHIETVVDHILALRPDIRIGLCSYTFSSHAISGATEQQVNQATADFEQVKRALAQRKDRVFYINNLGLMQYHYGIPAAVPPIPSETVPYPGGYPDYNPMPGGNIAYFAPLEAMFDNDIHLTPDGYEILARRCVDEFYGEWLSWPRVMEIVHVGANGAEDTFRVTFSKAVTGVDATDFLVSSVEGGKSPYVVSVTGSGVEYFVTVNLNGASGVPHLSLIDDDSITDLDGVPDPRPLGGPGAGNGNFTHNGPFFYEEAPPFEEDDFDGALRFLDQATIPYAEQLNGFSFAPELCDANGGFGGVDPLIIHGNGILDSDEFALIRACLRQPGLDLSATGGVTHSIAASAWTHNLGRMRSDLGGEDGLALTVFPRIDTVFAGFITLGDGISSSLPALVVLALSSMTDFPIPVTIPNVANYLLLPEYFGLDGDADGDGFSNAEEYAFFKPIGGRDLFLAAALNPNMTPEPECQNHQGGTFMAGESFCLIVPEPTALGAAFQWYKNGVPLQDGGYISGSNWRSLHILSLQVSDSGSYTCEYDNANKAPALFGPVEVVVVKGAPVASSWGLAVVALACGLGGAWRIRRKRRCC